MNQQKKLTVKQFAFVQAYCTPGKGYNNATQAAIIAGYSAKTAYSIGQRLLKHVETSKHIDRVKADMVAESKFTREKQLKDLEIARNIAEHQKNASAMVSATREQNEMLGYHRETAPNLEKEAARRAMTKKQEELARKFAYWCTEQESREPVKLPVRLVRGAS